MPIPSFENCYWVEPGRFLVGEYPGNRDDATAQTRLAALMATGVERFVPVYNGTASLSINQAIQFSGELILINKTSIEVMCIGDKSSQ